MRGPTLGVPGHAPAGGDARPESAPRFDAPEAWVREAPSSSMRLHQFKLPAPEGVDGAEDGAVAIVVSRIVRGLKDLSRDAERRAQMVECVSTPDPARVVDVPGIVGPIERNA